MTNVVASKNGFRNVIFLLYGKKKMSTPRIFLLKKNVFNRIHKDL